MLSSNFPAAVAAGLHSLSKSTTASGCTTIESFTCTRETTLDSSADEKNVTRRGDFVQDPNCSDLTTVAYPWTPEAGGHYRSVKKTGNLDVSRVLDIAFVDSVPSDSLVVDLSKLPPSPKVIIKTEPDSEPDSEDDDVPLATLKRPDCGVAFSPATPSGRSPPKKKNDSCPSDEKLFGRKPKAVVDEKENVEAFVVAAPCAVKWNAETTAKQSSHRLPFGKDKDTCLTALGAHNARKSLPKKTHQVGPGTQTAIAPDSRNKVSCKVADLVVDFEKIKPNEWSKVDDWKLKPGACKSPEAFVKASIVREAALSADRTGREEKKIVRATIKEAHDVYGDILVDIRLGRFDPVAAKRYVDGFPY